MRPINTAIEKLENESDFIDECRQDECIICGDIADKQTPKKVIEMILGKKYDDCNPVPFCWRCFKNKSAEELFKAADKYKQEMS